MSLLAADVRRWVMSCGDARDLCVWAEVSTWCRSAAEPLWKRLFGVLADRWLPLMAHCDPPSSKSDPVWLPPGERLNRPVGFPMRTSWRPKLWRLMETSQLADQKAAAAEVKSWRDRCTLFYLLIVGWRERYAVAWYGASIRQKVRRLPGARTWRITREWHPGARQVAVRTTLVEGRLPHCPPGGFRSGCPYDAEWLPLDSIISAMFMACPRNSEEAAFYLAKLAIPFLVEPQIHTILTDWIAADASFLPCQFPPSKPSKPSKNNGQGDLGPEMKVALDAALKCAREWRADLRVCIHTVHATHEFPAYAWRLLAAHGGLDESWPAWPKLAQHLSVRCHRVLADVERDALASGTLAIFKSGGAAEALKIYLDKLPADPPQWFTDAIVCCLGGACNADEIVGRWVGRLKDAGRHRFASWLRDDYQRPGPFTIGDCSSEDDHDNDEERKHGANAIRNATRGRGRGRAEVSPGTNDALEFFEMVGMVMAKVPPSDRAVRLAPLLNACHELLSNASKFTPTWSRAATAIVCLTGISIHPPNSTYPIHLGTHEHTNHDTKDTKDTRDTKDTKEAETVDRRRDERGCGTTSLVAVLLGGGWRVPLEGVPLGVRRVILAQSPPHLLSDPRWLLEYHLEVPLMARQTLQERVVALRKTLRIELQKLADRAKRRRGEEWHVLHDTRPLHDIDVVQGRYDLGFTRTYIRVRDPDDVVRTRLAEQLKSEAIANFDEAKMTGENLTWDERAIMSGDKPVDNPNTRWERKLFHRLRSGGRRRLLYALIVEVSNAGPVVRLKNTLASYLEQQDWDLHEWARKDMWPDRCDGSRLPDKDVARKEIAALLSTLPLDIVSEKALRQLVPGLTPQSATSPTTDTDRYLGTHFLFSPTRDTESNLLDTDDESDDSAQPSG